MPVANDALDPAQSRASDGQGLRDRKKHATYRALRDAALRLVSERGYAHVTVEDIAEAADVSTRTFFNYFPTKESAVFGEDPDLIERIRGAIVARPIEESPIDAVRAVMVELMADKDSESPNSARAMLFRRVIESKKDPELLAAFSARNNAIEHAVAEALAERLGVDPQIDLYPSLVSATVFAAIRRAAQHWVATGGTGSFADLTDRVMRCVSSGLENDLDRQGAGTMTEDALR